jgi:hypothetical protein
MQFLKGMAVIIALFLSNSAAYAGDWTFRARDGAASASALSTDGAVRMEIRCNTQTRTAVATLGTLNPAAGTLILTVRHTTGFVQSFSVGAHFYELDGGVIQSGPLSPFFLQAFSAAGVLTVENGMGARLGAWRLKHTVQTRQLLRTVCLV